MNLSEIDKNKIAKAWLVAADDLGIKVVAPFDIELEDGYKCQFIALIENFGSPKGTLVCSPEEWDDLGYMFLAEEHGYHCSGLYKVYEQYEREHFTDTLADWGWFGDETAAPAWLDNKS